MLKETIRSNGESGTADVIRSLRSISNHKGFFRDLFKINAKLNENKVKISFDRSGRPVLNGDVHFDAAQLRADLRQMPSTEVFANFVSSANGETAVASSAVVTGGRSSGGQRSSRSQPMELPMAVLSSIVKYLSSQFKRRFGDPQQLVCFVWRYYSENRDLIHDRLNIHFDQRFVSDVSIALVFIAQQAGQLIGQFIEETAAGVVWMRLNDMYESRWAELTMRVVYRSPRELYDSMLAGLDAVRQYISDGLGFRRTVEVLLDDLATEVVCRLLRLSQISFDTIVAMGLSQFPSFESFFGEILEVVTIMAQKAGFNDLSLYVLLMKRKEMDALHVLATDFYERMNGRTMGAKRCEKCGGSFSVQSTVDGAP